MRTLDLRSCSTGRERGLTHGRAYKNEIASLAEIRIYLACKISGFKRQALLRVADDHLPILRDFDSDLCDELVGIAEGAEISTSHIVVLNQYTDIRDLSPTTDDGGEGDYDGGCTMFWSRSPNGPIFAQTWDMHATAMPYVSMIRVADAAGGDAWVLGLTGCLGMTGLNANGLCIGINNLTSTDAKPGVVWSAIVRRVLREKNVSGAHDVLTNCSFGSGHNYLVADGEDVISVETSGQIRKTIFTGERESFVHCNHSFDPEVRANSRVVTGSSTFARQDSMEGSLAGRAVSSLEDAWERLGSVEGYPKSICTNMSTPETPHAAATCAVIAMELTNRRLFAVAGLTHAVAPTEYHFRS